MLAWRVVHGSSASNLFELLEELTLTTKPITSGVQTRFLTTAGPALHHCTIQLFSYPAYNCLTILDANTLFIEWLLAIHDISSHVSTIYSNPASVEDDGRLNIEFFHTQDWCDMSTKNMCKGENCYQLLSNKDWFIHPITAALYAARGVAGVAQVVVFIFRFSWLHLIMFLWSVSVTSQRAALNVKNPIPCFMYFYL